MMLMLVLFIEGFFCLVSERSAGAPLWLERHSEGCLACASFVLCRLCLVQAFCFWKFPFAYWTERSALGGYAR